MLHRRLWNNLPWNLGYNLTLNDSSVVRPTLWLMLGSIGATSKLHQREAIELQHRPVVMPIDKPGEPFCTSGVLLTLIFPSAAFRKPVLCFVYLLESVRQVREPKQGFPFLPVSLPPNLHLLSFSISGWNYSSDHGVHLRRVQSGQLGFFFCLSCSRFYIINVCSCVSRSGFAL